MCKREITRDEALVYLKGGKTELLTDFTSRFGRPFSATLVLKKNGRHGFEFPPRAKGAAGSGRRPQKAGSTRVKAGAGSTRKKAAARKRPRKEAVGAKAGNKRRKPAKMAKRTPGSGAETEDGS